MTVSALDSPVLSSLLGDVEVAGYFSVEADIRAMLDFDVCHIDWPAYLQDIHIPGLRRHVLRDLLFDGAALVIPLLFGVEYGPHPNGFYM